MNAADSPPAVLAREARLQASRILVIGTSSAGKSTFARRLGRLLELPPIEMDVLFWDRDWTPKPQADFLRLLGAETEADAWIADGNYGSARGTLWPRAEMAIWLNYSRPRVLWRGLRRTVSRCISQRELWHGNRESFRRSFLSRESILYWIWTTHERRRKELAALRRDAAYPNLRWIEFTRPRQAEAWLRQLESAQRLATAGQRPHDDGRDDRSPAGR